MPAYTPSGLASHLEPIACRGDGSPRGGAPFDLFRKFRQVQILLDRDLYGSFAAEASLRCPVERVACGRLVTGASLPAVPATISMLTRRRAPRCS